jgi:hypothetical protein
MSNSSASVDKVGPISGAVEVGAKSGAVEVGAKSGAVEVKMQSSTKDGTCIIFDFDDTFLCTSYLNSLGIGLNTPDSEFEHIRPELKLLEDAVANLLERALFITESVTIITNAQVGWVEYSCKKFLPKVYGILFLRRIEVMSARAIFECEFPHEPTIWKTEAFKIKISNYYKDKPIDLRKDVLSFGDSIHERVAVHKATLSLGSSTLTKSLKFIEHPTIKQLVKQQNLVTSCLLEMCIRDEDFDLILTIPLIDSE